MNELEELQQNLYLNSNPVRYFKHLQIDIYITDYPTCEFRTYTSSNFDINLHVREFKLILLRCIRVLLVPVVTIHAAIAGHSHNNNRYPLMQKSYQNISEKDILSESSLDLYLKGSFEW